LILLKPFKISFLLRFAGILPQSVLNYGLPVTNSFIKKCHLNILF